MRATSDNQSRYIPSRIYKKLKEDHSLAQSLSQSGEKNSQYGKLKTKELKKKISDGLKKFADSRIFGDDGKSEDYDVDLVNLYKEELKEKKIYNKRAKEHKSNLDKQKAIKQYREYYKIYNELGWKEFVIQTNYKYSHPNFVMRCKDILPEFVSQNRIKRGQ